MSHLDLQHIDPGAERTPAEEAHLARCVSCRAQLRAMQRYLEAVAPSEELEAAVSRLAEQRRRLSHSFLGSRAPVWFGETHGSVEERPDGPWWVGATEAPAGARERAEAIARLGRGALVQWGAEARGVASRMPAGATLDRWLALPGRASDRIAIGRVLEDVASSLAVLHSAGLAHGGLRERRILVSPDGRALLLFAGLEAGHAESDLAALRALAEVHLGLDLPGDADHVRLALVDHAVGHGRPVRERLERGDHVDRFIVRGLVDRGATAVVYGVRHRLLGTRHALKVPIRGSGALVGRLLREGRLQAHLRHPSIISVTDVIEVDGAPALLMPLVDGPSLAEAIRGQGYSLYDALDLFAGVAAGLKFAHDNGVIHRDLKPANVLLEPVPGGVRASIVDFGLGKAIDRDMSASMTRSGASLGTLLYAAPEQLADASKVDHRADLWALGRLLLELVALATVDEPTEAEAERFGTGDVAAGIERIAAGLNREEPAERMPLDDVVAWLSAIGARPVCEGPFADAVRAGRRWSDDQRSG